ncbi:putative translation factor [Trichinella spiralis]|uniref:putative translation factor n=1 Tax=Trichinella spiralis TaxID=6334 RepID=UPI0001EFE6D7|nr:putative translation factor [Trichinella spiralis]
MNNTHWRGMRSSLAFVKVTRKQAQHASQQSENIPHDRAERQNVTLFINFINSSIQNSSIFTAVDLCWTDKSGYWASLPIEDTNGLTCNISSLAVFAGTHPLVHTVCVIHGMKMISSRQKLKCSHKHTRKHTHNNGATQLLH